MSIDNFWNWIEQTHMVPVLWHRTNLTGSDIYLLLFKWNRCTCFYCFQTNCICFLNLQWCLKLSFFWAIKFGFIFLSDERARSFFFWLPLSHAVFDGVFFFFEYRLSNFIFTFLMNNCQIVKKYIHIYYKMFRSLSKGTPLNGISNPWQQALVGLGHCFDFVHS